MSDFGHLGSGPHHPKSHRGGTEGKALHMKESSRTLSVLQRGGIAGGPVTRLPPPRKQSQGPQIP